MNFTVLAVGLSALFVLGILGYFVFRRRIVASMRAPWQGWSKGLSKAHHAMNTKFAHVGHTFIWETPEAVVKYQRAKTGPGNLVAEWKTSNGGHEMMTIFEDKAEGTALYYPEIFDARPLPAYAKKKLEEMLHVADWKTLGLRH